MSAWPKVGRGGFLETPPTPGLSPTPASRCHARTAQEAETGWRGSQWASTRSEREALLPPCPPALSSGDWARLLCHRPARIGPCQLHLPAPHPRRPRQHLEARPPVVWPLGTRQPRCLHHQGQGHLPRAAASAWADGHWQLGRGQPCSSPPPPRPAQLPEGGNN